jgi:hypothetical protein
MQLGPFVEAITKLGGPGKTAKLFDGKITPGVVHGWLMRDHIPLQYLWKISTATGISLERFARYAYEQFEKGKREER